MVMTTSAVTAPCPVCATVFTPIRRQRYCSPACRQAAWRTRQPAPAATSNPDLIHPKRSRRAITVYACPDCDTRYLADQWCPDCNRPCRRVGVGGFCPSCEEPVTVDELLGQDHNQSANPENPG